MFYTVAEIYIHLFLIAVSLQLSGRFKQIAEKVQLFARLNTDCSVTWMRLREDYNHLGKLCRQIEEVLANMFLTVFANDFFIVLTQLYTWLK